MSIRNNFKIAHLTLTEANSSQTFRINQVHLKHLLETYNFKPYFRNSDSVDL